MVGSGTTNWKYDFMPSWPEYMYHRHLISTQLKESIEAAKCDFSGVIRDDLSGMSEECLGYMKQLRAVYRSIDKYDIYGKCWKSKSN